MATAALWRRDEPIDRPQVAGPGHSTTPVSASGEPGDFRWRWLSGSMPEMGN